MPRLGPFPSGKKSNVNVILYLQGWASLLRHRRARGLLTLHQSLVNLLRTPSYTDPALNMAQLPIDLASAHVRLALRAYFTALFLLLGFFGDRCCLQRTKLLLYRRRCVKITQITGWLVVSMLHSPSRYSEQAQLDCLGL
jgi:hypothetical protein